MVVHPLGNSVELDFRIVGVVDLFPTWYPQDGPLMVANLEYIFEMVGGEFMYVSGSNCSKDKSSK